MTVTTLGSSWHSPSHPSCTLPQNILSLSFGRPSESYFVFPRYASISSSFHGYALHPLNQDEAAKRRTDYGLPCCTSPAPPCTACAGWHLGLCQGMAASSKQAACTSCTWSRIWDKDLLRELWGFLHNAKSFDADHSTRTHHNLSVNVTAQSVYVTFVARQEEQWLRGLPPAADPLASILVLQVHLGLAVIVGRLVLPKRQKA